jgi:hypothetical protein
MSVIRDVIGWLPGRPTAQSQHRQNRALRTIRRDPSQRRGDADLHDRGLMRRRDSEYVSANSSYVYKNSERRW